jgi:transposase InsO family protein
VCRMVRLKEQHRHWGPRKIREVYGRSWGEAPSESSFKRILERCGLTEKKREREVRENARLCSGKKASAPNEVWTVDFKGWWHDGQGRCEPLTVRDEYSRYVLELRALPNAYTGTVQACFERLFEQHGVPQAIRSDNGSPFANTQGLLGLTRLSAWWVANGIELERSRPGCPQDNGGHERMHRDIAREVEGIDYQERQAALETWRREFNEERPHEALGMQVPAEVYRNSEQRWPGTPERLLYPGMATRRVNKRGEFSHEGERIFASISVGGWDIGLSPRADGDLEIYFCRLLLGVLDAQTHAFKPVTKPTKTTNQ